MKKITIRKAAVQDAAAIAGLLKELGYPNTPEFARQKIAALSKSEGDAVLVAEADGRVIGVAHLHLATLFHERGRLGRILAIVVTGDSRQSGVGEKLMTALETAARSAGCVKMEVTSGEHRHDAHTFYKRLGYIEKPRRFVKILE